MAACAGISSKSGAACRTPAANGSGWCLWHDPDRAADRKQAVRNGGKATSNGARLARLLPDDLADVPARLRAWLTRIEDGQAKPRDAEAFVAVVRQLVDVLRFAAELGEQHLEDRLQAVERRLGELGA